MHHHYFLRDSRFLWLAMISSTMPGSARVLVSPNSSNLLAATFLRILLMIFPDRVLGRPEQN